MAEQPANEVHVFLDSFGLAEYESALIEAGLENLEIIHQLEDDDINEIINAANMKENDIETFKNAINLVKNGNYNPNKQQEEFKYEYKTIESDAKVNDKENNKTIIFIGESGVGKTTLVNSLCNYLFNVKYNNKFRYKLIYENEKKENETQSQTQKVTPYYLSNLQNINYSLTIIDTPGFNENDLAIQNEFKKCFEKHKFIDAIYFVVKSTDTRLSEAQKYIVKKLLNLFDESFKENMFVLYSFSDGSTPPAVKAVQKLNIKYNTYFKINNSGFTFPDSNNNNETHKMYFNLGIKQFGIVFDKLNNIEPKSTKPIVDKIKMEMNRHHNKRNDRNNGSNWSSLTLLALIFVLVFGLYVWNKNTSPTNDIDQNHTQHDVCKSDNCMKQPQEDAKPDDYVETPKENTDPSYAESPDEKTNECAEPRKETNDYVQPKEEPKQDTNEPKETNDYAQPTEAESRKETNDYVQPKQDTKEPRKETNEYAQAT